MKILTVFMFSMISLSTFADATYVCKTELSKSPVDTFVIKHTDWYGASISYSRQSKFNQPAGKLQLVPGCAEGSHSENQVLDMRETQQSLYVECDGDGDAGYAKVKMNGGTIRGTITFPNGNLGYPDNTTLVVSCIKTQVHNIPFLYINIDAL